MPDYTSVHSGAQIDASVTETNNEAVVDIVALRNLSPADAQLVRLRNGSEYLWIDGDATPEDGYIIVESAVTGYRPGDVNEGRWSIQGSVFATTFGVTGDGVTDDTVAFQALCDASAGHTVWLPRNGTINIAAPDTGFQEKAITITTSGITFIGNGCTIRAASDDPGYNLIWITGNNNTFDGVTFDHRVTPENIDTAHITIKVHGTYTRFLQCEFKDTGNTFIVDASGISTPGNNFPAPPTVTNRGTFINRCRFDGSQGTAIITKSGGNRYARYTNCEFENIAISAIKLDGQTVPADGTYGRQVIIDNCVIHDCDTVRRDSSTAVASQGLIQVEEGFEDVIISNITFRNLKNTSPGATTFNSCFRVNSSNQTNQPVRRLHISNIIASDVDGWFARLIVNEPEDWVTLTPYEVGNIVKEGGVGYICKEDHTSGTFSTDLAAGKWTALEDLGIDTTLEDIVFDGMIVQDIDNNVFQLEASTTEYGYLKRLGIYNVQATACGGKLLSAVKPVAEHIVIDGVQAYDVTGGCVKIDGLDDAALTLVSISNVVTEHATGTTSEQIHIANVPSGDIHLSNITVSGAGTGNNGIWLEDSFHITGRGITVHNNAFHGLFIDGCDEVSISGIVAYNNDTDDVGKAGVAVGTAAGVTNLVLSNIHCYDDQVPQTQWTGILLGSGVTGVIVNNAVVSSGKSWGLRDSGAGNFWVNCRSAKANSISSERVLGTDQQAAIASLTDSTGGTDDGTLAAVSGSGADADINNNFSELHTKQDAILAALRTHGLIDT